MYNVFLSTKLRNSHESCVSEWFLSYCINISVFLMCHKWISLRPVQLIQPHSSLYVLYHVKYMKINSRNLLSLNMSSKQRNAFAMIQFQCKNLKIYTQNWKYKDFSIKCAKRLVIRKFSSLNEWNMCGFNPHVCTFHFQIVHMFVLVNQ